MQGCYERPCRSGLASEAPVARKLCGAVITGYQRTPVSTARHGAWRRAGAPRRATFSEGYSGSQARSSRSRCGARVLLNFA